MSFYVLHGLGVIHPSVDDEMAEKNVRHISGKEFRMRSTNVTWTLLGAASGLTSVNGSTLFVFLSWVLRNKNWTIKVRVTHIGVPFMLCEWDLVRAKIENIKKYTFFTVFCCVDVMASREFTHSRVTSKAFHNTTPINKKIFAGKLGSHITCNAMLHYLTANARVFVIFEYMWLRFYSLYGTTSALVLSKDGGPDVSNCEKRKLTHG